MPELERPNYDLAQQLGAYRAGYVPQGQRGVDKLNDVFNTVNQGVVNYDSIVKDALDRKKEQLGLQAGQQQMAPFSTYKNSEDIPTNIYLELEKAKGMQAMAGYRGEQAQNLRERENKLRLDEINRQNMDDPNSDISQSYQGMYKKLFNKDASGIPASTLGKFINAGKGDLTVGLKEDQMQNQLENQAINRVTSIRGDTALSKIEQQRDATIQAADTMKNIKNGTLVNSGAVFSDLLGQLWRARTGAAPTDQVMKHLNDSTAKGDLAGAFTYVTGQPAGKTTQDILNNLSNFINTTGTKLDAMHDSYMTTHTIKPTGLEDERWKNIIKSHRGMTFAESIVGQNTNQSEQNFTPDVLNYAQKHGITPEQANQIKMQRTSNGLGR